MKSSSNPNVFSPSARLAKAEDNENEPFCDEINQIMTKYDIPFTQTSLSRMDISIFTSKLREISINESSSNQINTTRKNWLLFIKNYLLIQRLNVIHEYFLKVKSGGQFLLQRKFFQIWKNKTIHHSNREKWIRLASIIREINWNRTVHDQSSKLDKRRIDTAAKYLISQKEYQNPRYNFFILKVLPIITDKQKRIQEEELEEDRQADLRNFTKTENSSIINISNEISPDKNVEIVNRGFILSPPQSPSTSSSDASPKKKKKIPVKKYVQTDIETENCNLIENKSVKLSIAESLEKCSGANVNNAVTTSEIVQKKSKVFIITAIVLFVAAAAIAFALGYGKPLIYLIHKGEYNDFNDYMNSLKKRKSNDNSNNIESDISKPVESEQLLNNFQDQSIQSNVPLNGENDIPDVNHLLDEHNQKEQL